MFFLVLGVLIWSFAHFFKRLAPQRRAAMGDRGKGLVALVLFASIALMVIGYRSADSVFLWERTSWSTTVNNLLMIVAIYFVTPGPSKGALFYKMRHPMLSGFVIWVVAHLLVNGDSASLVLFGGLGVWALITARLINRAEPDWEPNPKGTIAKDITFVAISILITGIIGSIHLLFGLTPFGG